jgi:hypothetical protein
MQKRWFFTRRSDPGDYMKRFVCSTVFLLQFCFVSSAFAALCATGPLAGYLGVVFTCTFGSLQFSNFKVLQEPTGASAFPSLAINPVTTGPNEFGLQFVVNQTANAGQLFEELIGYRVTGLSSSINRNTLSFAGSNATVDGVVSALEQKCLDGIFSGADGVSGCTGTALNQAVLNIGGAADPPIFVDFPPVAFTSVVSDIAVDGGLDGTGALASATNLFRVVPAAPAVVDEPASSFLATTCLLLLLAMRRKTVRQEIRGN